MINNRNLRKQKTLSSFRRFRSYTDINNYNNFLIELDKKNIFETTQPINEKQLQTDTNSEKKDITNFINTTNKKFYKFDYSNKNVTGVSIIDSLLSSIEKNLDPNLYQYKEPFVSEKIIIPEKKNNKPIIKKEKFNIIAEINNINDLLTLIDTYPINDTIEYNINMSALHNIKEPLSELNNMIGMKTLKENIIDQILFYIQNLHTLKSDIKSNDFMHTVIYGPPGTGKTEIAKIMGSIFSKMGILSKGTFRKVTRSDLIAGYLGQTALKTRDVIKECLGGVLFIDEAYALGNEDKRDSFSKECIDTLCEALSDYKDNLMVIIAGYETDLNTCFFNQNQGLNSRFTWRFKTDEYTAEDLYKIFFKKVEESNWSIDNIDVKWFEKNKSHFNFFGRDIETLFAKTKIAHSRRVFCLDETVKTKIIIEDLDRGLEIFLKNEDTSKKEKEKFNKIISSMYI
jgi:ATP-dependent 26S proteasome regulatory subunit